MLTQHDQGGAGPTGPILRSAVRSAGKTALRPKSSRPSAICHLCILHTNQHHIHHSTTQWLPTLSPVRCPRHSRRSDCISARLARPALVLGKSDPVPTKRTLALSLSETLSTTASSSRPTTSPSSSPTPTFRSSSVRRRAPPRGRLPGSVRTCHSCLVERTLSPSLIVNLIPTCLTLIQSEVSRSTSSSMVSVRPTSRRSLASSFPRPHKAMRVDTALYSGIQLDRQSYVETSSYAKARRT